MGLENLSADLRLMYYVGLINLLEQNSFARSCVTSKDVELERISFLKIHQHVRDKKSTEEIRKNFAELPFAAEKDDTCTTIYNI